MSLGVFDGACLADDGHPDLARVAERALDAVRDVASHELSLRLVDRVRLDQDPHLASGLARIALFDALEGVGDLLALLDALVVGLERFPAGSGPGRRRGRRREQRE